MPARWLSALVALIIAVVFLLPSSIAVYAAMHGGAWDLLDVSVPELLAPALVSSLLLPFAVTAGLSPSAPEVTHPVLPRARLFELDCALIC